MAGNDLNLNLSIDSKKAQQSLRDAAKEAKKLGTDLDDTRSAGKKVADELKRMADSAAADMSQARSATEKLTTALGDELVAEARAAGGSVEGLVGDLRKLGLTYEEIEAEAEELANAIKYSSQVGKQFGDDINDGARRAADGLDKARASGDQSRSVFANLAGNSVQDLGELGGVAGTAGVALGQLAEYAADGNIQLKNLAAFVGPMAAVGLAVFGISKFLGSAREKAEQAKKETKLWIDVLQQADDALNAKALEEEYRGTISALEDLGFTARDWYDAMVGQNDLVDQLGSRYAELNDKVYAAQSGMGSLTDAELDEYEVLTKLLPNLREQVESRDNAVVALDEQTKRQQVLTNAMRDEPPVITDLISHHGRLIDRVEETGEAFEETEEQISETDLALQKLRGNLSEKESWRNMKESLGDLMTAMADTESSWDDLAEASDDAVSATADYIEQAEDIPDEVKTVLYQELDRGNLDEVQRILDDLKQGVDVPVRFQGGGGGPIKYRAKGGPVEEDEPYIVGEEGQELFVPNTNGTIIPASLTKRILSGAQKFRTKATTWLSGGGSAAGSTEGDNMGNKFEAGAIDLATYRAYLTSKLDSYEKYSNEYMAVWRTLNGLAKQEADQQAKAAKEAQDAAKAAEEAAKKALAESDARVKKAYEEAKAQQELAAAVAAADEAYAALANDVATDPLNWKGQRAGLEQQFADALYRRADASANASGIADGTVEWARAVRSSLENDKLNAPNLTPYIDQILRGIPQLAEGGIVKRRAGGTLVNVGEGNYDEAVVPLKGGMGVGGNRTININLPPMSPRAIAQALRDYERYDVR